MENTQSKAKFEPAAEHIVFADAYIQNQGNISLACSMIGDPHRNTYYGKNGYRHIDGFDAWLSEYAKEEVLKRRGKWFLILEKYAEAGSYQHLNLLMQIAKEFTPEPLIKHEHYVTIYRPEPYPRDSLASTQWTPDRSI